MYLREHEVWGCALGNFLWWPSQVFLLPLGSLEELLGEWGGWTSYVLRPVWRSWDPQYLDMMGIIRIYIHIWCMCIFLLVQAECCWFCLIKLSFGNFSDPPPLQVYSILICHLVNIAKWLLNAFILLIFLDPHLDFLLYDQWLYCWLWFHRNYLLYNFKLKTGLS